MASYNIPHLVCLRWNTSSIVFSRVRKCDILQLGLWSACLNTALVSHCHGLWHEPGWHSCHLELSRCHLQCWKVLTLLCISCTEQFLWQITSHIVICKWYDNVWCLRAHTKYWLCLTKAIHRRKEFLYRSIRKGFDLHNNNKIKVGEKTKGGEWVIWKGKKNQHEFWWIWDITSQRFWSYCLSVHIKAPLQFA